MYDLAQIKLDTEARVNDLLTAVSNYWHQIGITTAIKSDGGTENYWIRSEAPNGEGSIFIPAHELPSLAIAIQKLAEVHVRNYHASLGIEEEVEAPAPKWQKKGGAR